MKIDGLTIEERSARTALRLAAATDSFRKERRDFMDHNGIDRSGDRADQNRRLVQWALDVLQWNEKPGSAS
jgi:hypothetical protein